MKRLIINFIWLFNQARVILFFREVSYSEPLSFNFYCYPGSRKRIALSKRKQRKHGCSMIPVSICLHPQEDTHRKTDNILQ